MGYLERRLSWRGVRYLTLRLLRKIDRLKYDRSPQQISDRLDRLIAEIREKYHKPALEGNSERPDVLLVAHGHILRAFAMRWIGRDLTTGVSLLLESMAYLSMHWLSADTIQLEVLGH